MNLLYTDKGRGFWYLEGHSDFPYEFLYLFVDGAIKCKRAQKTPKVIFLGCHNNQYYYNYCQRHERHQALSAWTMLDEHYARIRNGVLKEIALSCINMFGISQI